MGNKATNAETNKRVNTLYKMLLSGADRAEIIQYGSENYEIGERAIDDLIAKANEAFEEASKHLREVEFGKALTRLNNLYARSLKVQDFKTALSVQREINALLGLNTPTRLEHTGKDGGAIQTESKVTLLSELSDEELDRIIANKPSTS
jgi:hypothetical protein